MQTHTKPKRAESPSVNRILLVILLSAALLLDPIGLLNGNARSLNMPGLPNITYTGEETADSAGYDEERLQTFGDFNSSGIAVVEENGECTYLSLDGAGYDREILENSLSMSVDSYKSILQTVGTTMYNGNEEALNTVFRYNEVIAQAAVKYGVEKAMIQAILFQEIRFINILDEVDTFVQTTFYCLHQREDADIDDWTGDFISESVLSTINITDSSTGLGQIYAKSAIKALNWYLGSEVYDYNNWRDIEAVWVKLKYDDEYNVDMIGLILSYNRYLCEHVEMIQEPAVGDILRLYNGYGPLAEKYEEVTVDFYKAFGLYNEAVENGNAFEPV
jgi:hypothetical protein